MKIKALLLCGLVAPAFLFATGCAPSSYAVKTPQPSRIALVTESPAAQIGFVDSRGVGERNFNTGVLPATLTVGGVPLNGAEYFKAGVQAELAARGIPANFGEASVFPKVDLRSFRMLNHRQNAYSPYVTFTFISADVETAAGRKRIGVFVKRGKVPVWSFDEVVEPTMNEPLSIAIKEFSAKLARELYGARASDSDVDALIARLSKPGDEDYLDVYALGFTNHPKAIDAMARLAKDDHEYVRIAAISSLGTLRANDQLDQLKEISRKAQTWQDRAMALKAIGDLDTTESRAFIAEQKAYWQAQPAGKESNWTLQVLDLYP